MLSSPTKPPETTEGLLLGNRIRESKHTQLEPETVKESKWRTHYSAATGQDKAGGGGSP